ncbi:MAG: hypothetical protein SOH81_12585 [Acetobacter sp.]|jgi:hypothetical protein
MLDAKTADFDDLIGDYPNFDKTDLRDRCVEELSLRCQTQLKALDERMTNRPGPLNGSLKIWCRNNEELMRCSADLLRNADTARAEAEQRRLKVIESDPMMAGMTTGEKTASASGWVSQRFQALQEIENGFQPLDLTPTTSIYRGGALLIEDFMERFPEGEEVILQHMTACTISSDFAPLFYAKKQYDDLQGAASEVCSYMLEIQLKTPQRSTMHWTAHIKGENAATTYRWQLEVIAPTDFQYRVEAVKLITPDGYPKLYQVTATEV